MTTPLNSKTCRSCSKTFDSMQKCLAHEMIAHVKLTNQPPASRKRRRPQKLKLVESEHYKLLRKEAIEEVIRAANGFEYTTLARIYQPSSENLFEVYERLVEDLEKNLKSHGQYKIQPFGSAITGMSFKGEVLELLFLKTKTHHFLHRQ